MTKPKRRTTCALARTYGELAAQLPVDPEEIESRMFTRESLPAPPTRMHSSRLILQKRQHAYGNSYRVDSIHFNLGRDTARQLGLLFFACLLHRRRVPTRLFLDHPESDIRQLVFPSNKDDFLPAKEERSASPGLLLEPVAYVYRPSWTSIHPFETVDDVWDLPGFELTTLEDSCVREEDWQRRDILQPFSLVHGMALFGALLLDAGSPKNEDTRYDLEGEAGVRGVAPTSVEIRVFLRSLCDEP